MIAGFFWQATANAGAALTAYALLQRIRAQEPDVNVLLFLLIRIGLLSSVVLTAGLTGTLIPSGLGIPFLIVLVGWVAFRARRGPLVLPRPRMSRTRGFLWGVAYPPSLRGSPAL